MCTVPSVYQVDIINFGESEENTPLLEKFVDTVNANDSNLVTVEPGKLLSDVLVSTPIFRQGGGQISEFGGLGSGQDADLQAAIRASQGDASGGAAASGGPAFGGVDPNTDPGTLRSAHSLWCGVMRTDSI